MSHFEHDLYEKELPPAEWQTQWWEYVARVPGHRAARRAAASDLCDACTKTHINDDAAQYYDYALATVIKFQLHDHICTQDPQAGRARLQLLRQQGGRRLPARDPGAGRDARLARRHQGRDRRADLAARDDGVLRAAASTSSPSATPGRTARADGRQGQTRGAVAAARRRRGLRRRPAAVRGADRGGCARAASIRSGISSAPPRRSRRSPPARRSCRGTPRP